MGSVVVTPLEMNEIQKLTENVYALNNSDRGRTKPKGVLHLLVSDSSGQEVQINIPRTWVPINLGDYCNVKDIVQSSKFREYVRKGVIVIISDLQANALLDSAEGRAEMAKLREADGKMSASLKKDYSGQNARVTKHGEAPSNAPPSLDALQNKAPVIDPQVSKLIEDYRAGMSDTTAVEAVRTINGDKDSWIWASMQVHDTSSTMYLALSDKISDFDDENANLGSFKAEPAAPAGTFVVNT